VVWTLKKMQYIKTIKSDGFYVFSLIIVKNLSIDLL